MSVMVSTESHVLLLIYELCLFYRILCWDRKTYEMIFHNLIIVLYLEYSLVNKYYQHLMLFMLRNDISNVVTGIVANTSRSTKKKNKFLVRYSHAIVFWMFRVPNTICATIALPAEVSHIMILPLVVEVYMACVKTFSHSHM